MKKPLMFLSGLFILLLLAVSANATLVTIGTAKFNGTGTEYNLIYDADSPFGPITWLDYSNNPDTWDNQVLWAAGLNRNLTYNTPGYTVNWGNSNWRLPLTVDDGFDTDGYTGNTTVGYNIITSEMGHLFYEELRNIGYYDTLGQYQPLMGLKNIGDFKNLDTGWYWSSTEWEAAPTNAFDFLMNSGNQGWSLKGDVHRALPITNVQVSEVPVPEPSTLFLLGSGFLGVAGVSRKKK